MVKNKTPQETVKGCLVAGGGDGEGSGDEELVGVSVVI